MLKRTPLYAKHVELKGKIVDFAGYELPVQYTSVIAEHNAVRQAAGLFDVSHMGELFFTGTGAESALNDLVSNDIRGMYDGQCRYALLTNLQGGAVDDVLVYRVNQEVFFLVVNGANVEKDAKWCEDHLTGENVKFENRSEEIAQIALQGPKAIDIVNKLVSEDNIPQKNYSFKANVDVKGIKVILSRTGYTAEDGFEFYCAANQVIALYDILLAAGEEFGAIPCGLGARDTLRLEGAMPLYGHELNEDISIDEVGLGFAIKMKKEHFIGKEALENHKVKYVRLGAEVVSRGIAREGCKVFYEDQEVGYVTSGTFAPTLNKAICMLRVKEQFASSPLKVEVRGKMLDVAVVPMPFYKRNK